MYRLNDAAIMVEGQNAAEVVLRCSDGIGALQFDDLVVEITRQSQADRHRTRSQSMPMCKGRALRSALRCSQQRQSYSAQP